MILVTQWELMLMGHSPYAMYSAQHFTCMVMFESHLNPLRWILLCSCIIHKVREDRSQWLPNTLTHHLYSFLPFSLDPRLKRDQELFVHVSTLPVFISLWVETWTTQKLAVHLLMGDLGKLRSKCPQVAWLPYNQLSPPSLLLCHQAWRIE